MSQINQFLEQAWQRMGPNVPVAGTFSRSPRFFLPLLLAEAGAGAEVIDEWNNLNVLLLPLPPTVTLVEVEAQIEVVKTAIDDGAPDYSDAGIAWGIAYAGNELVEWSGTTSKAAVTLAKNLTTSGLVPYLAPLTFDNLQEWGSNADEIATQCKGVVDNTLLLRAGVSGGAAPTTLTTSAVAIGAATSSVNAAVAAANATNEEITGTTVSTLDGATTALGASTTLVQNILTYLNANAGTEIVSGGPYSTLAAWFAAQNP